MVIKKVLIFLLLLSVFVFSISHEKNNEAGDKEIGYILLNDLVLTFENYDPNKSQTEWKEKVLNSLNTMFNSAKQARAKKEIDKFFFECYKRILYVLELSLRMQDSEDKSVLVNLINEQVKKFEVQKELLNKPENELFGSIAGAVAEEILGLKEYLDWENALYIPESDRPKIIKSKKKSPGGRVSTKRGKLGDENRDPVENSQEGKLKDIKEPVVFEKGSVLLEVVIDKKGSVLGVRLIQSKHPHLEKFVIETVKKYKFEPYKKDNILKSVRFKLTLYYY